MNTNIVGSFTIEKDFAKGSFGTIYTGYHTLLKIPVAIKRRIPQSQDDRKHKEFFIHEAKILTSLQNAYLPMFWDYIENSQGDFIIYRFIEGDTLEQMVQKNGAIKDNHVCWILERSLEALSYCHYLGVIHCDINPKNVIVKPEKHAATLIDFGLAVEGPNDYTRAKGGSPGYIPPEFLQGLPPVPASDLYSLAKCAIYAMGGNAKSGVIPDETSDELKNFLGDMLIQDAMQRPNNAADLIRQLKMIRKKVFGRTSEPEAIEYKK